jgi:hypothetical protein
MDTCCVAFCAEYMRNLEQLTCADDQKGFREEEAEGNSYLRPYTLLEETAQRDMFDGEGK